MPELRIKCQDCGAFVTADCGQTVIDGVLRWYLSYRCAKCSTAIEVDGQDETPSEIRDAVIAEAGEWELYRTNPHSNVAQFAKSLRSLLGFTIAEATKLAKAEAVPFYHGTRPEVDWLFKVLEREGIESNAVLILKQANIDGVSTGS